MNTKVMGSFLRYFWKDTMQIRDALIQFWKVKVKVWFKVRVMFNTLAAHQ